MWIWAGPFRIMVVVRASHTTVRLRRIVPAKATSNFSLNVVISQLPGKHSRSNGFMNLAVPLVGVPPRRIFRDFRAGMQPLLCQPAQMAWAESIHERSNNHGFIRRGILSISDRHLSEETLVRHYLRLLAFGDSILPNSLNATLPSYRAGSCQRYAGRGEVENKTALASEGAEGLYHRSESWSWVHLECT